MKKIININFHGRVVPIEESAHELLQQYVDSLRRYFANEEGRDEIINDIENRFAELFSELLKKGSTCITDADVNSIIASMGRPEDFEQDDISSGSASSTGSAGPNPGTSNTGQAAGSRQPGYDQQKSGPFASEEPRRLYRSENDKMLGGVCGGLANYLRLDPSVVRILFVIFSFVFGIGFPLYFILWIVLPKKSLADNVRKRLYRNPDDRVIAGVASGLASYFHIEVWIPRLIFALPLILSLITSVFRHAWFDFDRGPLFVTGGFGMTLFITYIVLWIVLPEAITASEKLEMRGEKVDLESIKNTIKSDLEGFKNKARDMGDEVKERFQQAGQDLKQAGSQFANTAGPVVRNRSNGLGHAIGIIFKAFFLFIGGIIALAMISVLAVLLFNGATVFPFKYYILSGFWQNFMALASLVLFMGVPIIALVLWLIRRMMGVRSRNNYLGYTLGSLWVIGLICLITLLGMVFNNFRSRAGIEDTISLSPSTPDKMLVRINEGRVHYYDNDWFGIDWDNNKAPFYNLTEDTVMMNTVRVRLIKSQDGEFHMQRVKFSRGNNPAIAKTVASEIQFDIRQQDSNLYLPQGFVITKEEKFRNQQVLVNIAIPVGKKIWVSGDIDNYHWFNIKMNNRNDFFDEGIRMDDNNDWDNSYSYDTNTEYVMTENGLKRTHPRKHADGDDNDDDNDKSPATKDENPASKDKTPETGGSYRYKKNTDSVKPAKPGKTTNVNKNTDTINIKKISKLETPEKDAPPSYLLSALFL
ncbi:MAG: PspC domain-containing protein [Puia sp.]|nr:PspC domain-containing protein [Puia sp.]